MNDRGHWECVFESYIFSCPHSLCLFSLSVQYGSSSLYHIPDTMMFSLTTCPQRGSLHWNMWELEIKLYPSSLELFTLEFHHNNKANKMDIFYFKAGEKGERRWGESKREAVRRRKEENQREGRGRREWGENT